jgi:hypothetical protein
MWPLPSFTAAKPIYKDVGGTSSFRLLIILGGTGIILFGVSSILNSIYPFFDDIHESDSEASDSDSDSESDSDD